MTGAMPTAQYLLSAILALLPSPHLQESLEALLLLLLQGHGKARPQHSQTKSPARCFPHGKAAALSRFFNRYAWPTRTLIRLARREAERALDRARPRRGSKPRLLVVLDLVTLEKRGLLRALPLSFFHGKWGLHLGVVYLVHGELRIPWSYRVWRGKGEKSLSLLALRLLASLPPWMRKAFRVRVVADTAFGTIRFLRGVRELGLEAVVGMRRFSIEHFFKAMKSEFSLGQFGQRTALGVHRFLVLSPLAYLLAHWVKLASEEKGCTWWEAARRLFPEPVALILSRELSLLGLWPPPPGKGVEDACLCGICGRCKF
ncbi:transposase [Thermus antranikianii]|uniref:Transposase n=2 Tax=Thermus antranikianii TaxID=88190 RepID=A0ABY7RP32_9DEIN|nr:hypothetical protein [Thermus antranikianii]WCM39393.1 transposase [Thermus antranikianii]